MTPEWRKEGGRHSAARHLPQRSALDDELSDATAQTAIGAAVMRLIVAPTTHSSACRWFIARTAWAISVAEPQPVLHGCPRSMHWRDRIPAWGN